MTTATRKAKVDGVTEKSYVKYVERAYTHTYRFDYKKSANQITFDIYGVTSMPVPNEYHNYKGSSFEITLDFDASNSTVNKIDMKRFTPGKECIVNEILDFNKDPIANLSANDRPQLLFSKTIETLVSWISDKVYHEDEYRKTKRDFEAIGKALFPVAELIVLNNEMKVAKLLKMNVPLRGSSN